MTLVGRRRKDRKEGGKGGKVGLVQRGRMLKDGGGRKGKGREKRFLGKMK